jgi:hypothetical protein
MKEISESVNPIVIRLSGYRQFCELLSLVCLTLAACGFILLDEKRRWWWTFAWLFALLTFLWLASYFGRRAILEFIDAQFCITERRIETLEAIRAPEDLVRCLQALSPATYRGEQYFFSQLGRLLTLERCAELRGMIFKYTYAGRKKWPTKKPLTANATQPSTTTAPASTNTLPTT